MTGAPPPAGDRSGAAVEVSARAREFVASAERLADEMWWPQAPEVDASATLPPGLLDAAADAGLYAVAAPVDDGGLGPTDPASAGRITEALVSGCLSAALVWMQHHGVVLGVAGRPALRERWLSGLTSGRVRAGVCLAGARPGPRELTATWDGAGWVLHGWAPWVTGYGLVDVIRVAAVEVGSPGAGADGGEQVVELLVDAVTDDTVALRWPELSAARASSTAQIEYRGHRVPADRLISRRARYDWSAADATGNALNGFFALGVVRRCALLLRTDAFAAEAAQCRDRLVGADGAGLAAARASASLLAQRAAAAVVVDAGARAVTAGGAADLMWREAAFSLVFGNRQGIQHELRRRLTGAQGTD